MIEGYRQLARYNQWANAHLYATALKMPQERYRASTGVFFRSLHGTLNHLLVADRVWLRRLTGIGPDPRKLDEILCDDRRQLAVEREAEDVRIIAVVDGYDAAALNRSLSYQTMSGQPQEQTLADILRHVFNHQTHHRGQAHACVSMLGLEAPPLDLLLFQRGVPAPDLRPLFDATAQAD
jgi:uncharacterized damage-inducible protein DinB